MYPVEINVLSEIYTVVWCETLIEVSGDVDSILWGTTDFAKKQIRCFKFPGHVSRMQCLAHELIHCYLHALGLEETLEEAHIDAAATLLVDFLIRNKVTVWITE